jgi:purine-binding chemotaxis protein CheW
VSAEPTPLRPGAPPATETLVDQQLALSHYLEALLNPAPAALPVPVATRPAVELLTPVVAEVRNAPPLAEEAEIVPVVAPAVAVAPVPASAPPATPDWASGPFACLLLSVNGLSLALPLVKLNRILPWTEPSPLPGYAPWLLGIVHHLDTNVRVIDTAGLVMPEIRRPTPGEAGAAGERHIVLIGDGHWGLVCEHVSEVITLDPERIRWRASRGQRPWLAGTLVEQLCALLDVEELSRVLENGCPGLPAA